MAKKETGSAGVSPSPSPGSSASPSSSEPAPSSSSLPPANEFFTPGSVLRLKTRFDDVMEGEMLSFDPKSRIIVIKSASSSGKRNLVNLNTVNLNHCSAVEIIKEVDKPVQKPILNAEMLKSRLQKNVDRRRMQQKAFKKGVSHEGQNVFQYVSKAYDETEWSGEKIVVMGKVTIHPPYLLENVTGDERAKQFIVKMLKRYYKQDDDAGGQLHQPAGASSMAPPEAASNSSLSAAAVTDAMANVSIAAGAETASPASVNSGAAAAAASSVSTTPSSSSAPSHSKGSSSGRSQDDSKRSSAGPARNSQASGNRAGGSNAQQQSHSSRQAPRYGAQ